MSRHKKSPSEGAVGIRGVGVVAPQGVGVEVFWQRLLAGESTPPETPPSIFDAPVPARAHTLEATGFEAGECADPRIVRRLSRYSAMSLIAAQEAMGSDNHDGEPRDDAAVILGTAFGSGVYHFEYYNRLFENGLKEASPLLFSESVINAATGHITHRLGLRGPGLALVGGEDVALKAAALALDKLRLGDVSSALVGGTDEYCDVLHASLAAQGIVARDAQDAACPYGEGSAVLMLQRVAEDASVPEDALAFLAGAGNARSPRGTDASDAVRMAVSAALRDAQMEASDIDLIVSGAGIRDVAGEFAGLVSVLDAERPRIICAPKTQVGEAFAFSSATQLLVATLALARGEVPPSPRTRFDLPGSWRVPQTREKSDARNALAVCGTRAGSATAVILRRGAEA